MTDTATQKRVNVSPAGTAVPYIMASVDQLPEIRRILDANQVRYWVDEFAISLSGGPSITVINLGRGVDAAAVQKLLDDIQ